MPVQRARLSFREHKRGGKVLQEPRATPHDALAVESRPVLLIHGYNNDQEKANRAYRAFQEIQRQLAGLAPGRPVANGRLVEIYWPGDADWGVVSFLYYMGSIGKAKETAKYLAATLERAAKTGGFKQVDIVAHSMGCRLTAELLTHLKDAPNLVIRRIVFMAAALPTFMLAPQSGLRRAYDAVLTDAALSLYSPADSVLGLAFPLGQSIAPGKEGLFPTALGHDLWAGSVPPNLRQFHNVDARHSDYWPGGKKRRKGKRGRAARRANEQVREFLELGLVARSLPSRELSERDTEDERSLDYAREIADRPADGSFSGTWEDDLS